MLNKFFVFKKRKQSLTDSLNCYGRRIERSNRSWTVDTTFSFFPSSIHPSIHQSNLYPSIQASSIHPPSIHPSSIHSPIIHLFSVHPSSIQPLYIHPAIIHSPTIYPSIHFCFFFFYASFHLSLHPSSLVAAMKMCLSDL